MKTPNPTTKKDLLGIADPNTPIFRIFPVWRLQHILQTNRMALVSPKMWDDPFEMMAESIALGRIIVGSDKPLPKILAQCWSATKESDALWRVYSRVRKDKTFERNIYPSEEGVRVKSTPAKLLDALSTQITDAVCYVGAVKYMPQDDLLQEITNVVAAKGPNVFCHPNNRAILQLRKRVFFEHEDEMRALVVWPDGYDFDTKDILISPNDIFEQITFDPRLSAQEMHEREDSIRNLGYTGEIERSNLYTRVVLSIVPATPPTGAAPPAR